MSVTAAALRLFMANGILPWARDVSLLAPGQGRLLIGIFLPQEDILDQLLFFLVSRVENVGVVAVVVSEDDI